MMMSAPTLGNLRDPDGTSANEKVETDCTARRSRTNFSEAQVSALETLFQRTHYPDNVTKRRLACTLQLADDRITVWFQNRRAKWRRREKNQPQTTRKKVKAQTTNEWTLTPSDNTKVYSGTQMRDEIGYRYADQWGSYYAADTTTTSNCNPQSQLDAYWSFAPV